MNTAKLLELFEYEDGKLINRVFRSPRALKGSEAGRLNQTTGYRDVAVEGKRYQVSRLIWQMHNGEIPEGMQIDHINRDKLDNRIENLRCVTPTQNEWNKPCSGVNFEKGKWRARFKHFGKSIHVGLFETKDEALAAYQKALSEIRPIYPTQIRGAL